VDLFEALNESIRQPDQQSQYGLSGSEVSDSFGRFKIWAGNIETLQKFVSKSSLDYRIQDAPKIGTQIISILDDLAEFLEDGVYDPSNIREATCSQHLTNLATSILSNRMENRPGSVAKTRKEADAGLDLAETDADDCGSDSDEGVSEIQEIFTSIADSISSLFRFSIIIRNNTNRDSYAKANVVAAGSSYDDKYDTNHVREKFPALEKGNEWLITRLGKAITTKRQYLRYCESII
jgi:hypothetical protein